MLKQLRKMVCAANKRFSHFGLKASTWGTVSGIERERGLVVIKPADVSNKELTHDDMIIVDLDGQIVEGVGELPCDIATHLRLYEAFSYAGGIANTRSSWAVVTAQAGLSIPAYSTSHIELFKGDIPCTRTLSDEEIYAGYERNVGNVIVETFANLDYMAIPGVLVKNHAPFAWGVGSMQAVQNVAAIESLAKMAYRTRVIGKVHGVYAEPVSQALIHIKSQQGQ